MLVGSKQLITKHLACAARNPLWPFLSHTGYQPQPPRSPLFPFGEKHQPLIVTPRSGTCKRRTVDLKLALCRASHPTVLEREICPDYLSRLCRQRRAAAPCLTGGAAPTGAVKNNRFSNFSRGRSSAERSAFFIQSALKAVRSFQKEPNQ